ncbi:DUF4430 domain-containing protein [Enterococcus mediterraneensis]|uniref:DUF4430 domain-containing protein n=1 Tax=Enterococcus mediterraneensis TaxID=2364791 RepID=UPI000F047964|nr:DUF4430 domain-containing protein [Enterococcus mediterraneensis]
MKKIITASLLVISTLVIGGCSTPATDTAASTTTEKTTQQTVTITLKEDKQQIDSKKIEVKEKANLFDTMKENFTIKDEDGFITSIEGHEQDPKENKYWTYTINGEPAMKGAKETILKQGDKVVFELEKTQ